MPYYFNLPVFDELTIHQKLAINETRQLSLSGGPGTGKSVVCLWRHIRNYATNSRRSLLLTYTKTLEHYLKLSASPESVDNIDRIYKWLYSNDRLRSSGAMISKFDEIIIDEGQDVEVDKFKKFFTRTNKVSYGADKRQSLYLKEEQLNELFDWLHKDERFENNSIVDLSINFRNSKEILEFTRSVFPDFLIPQNTINCCFETTKKPIMKINVGNDIKDQCKEIKGIVEDFSNDSHNIGVLVPYARRVDEYYDELKQLLDNTKISKYQSGDDGFSELEGVHITTFKSAKGIEFDTVIIPKFDSFRWYLDNMEIISENDYYVAFTRAKRNLFLICSYGYPNIGDRNTVNIEG